MRRREFASLALALAGPARAATRQPNILILVADDMGWGDPGYHGSEIKTFHIDSIANSGVRFTHFYAYPWCSPTRAALMTGRSALTLGCTGHSRRKVKKGCPWTST